MRLPPVEIELTGHIEAPPEDVWRHLVDWENLPRWMSEASSIVVTSAAREGVGVEAIATLRIGGIRTADPIRVTRWEPPAVLEVEHRGWVKGSGVMRCTRHGRGTRLDWKEVLIPPLGIVGAIGIRLWRPLMRRTFERDLRLLTALVEAGAEGSAVGPPGPSPAAAPPEPRRRASKTRARGRLYLRWLWVVHTPIALLAGGVVLLARGTLRGPGTLLLIPLGAWSAAAFVLLAKRRRAGLRVGAPPGAARFLGAVVGLLLIGAALGWAGLERLATDRGTALALLGGFLVVLALVAPAFKLLDLGLRRARRPSRASLVRPRGEGGRGAVGEDGRSRDERGAPPRFS